MNEHVHIDTQLHSSGHGASIRTHGEAKLNAAVAIWPVTGQGFPSFKTINDRQSGIFNKFDLSKLRIPTNPNYHMSIKKSQAILKCFIDLKPSVWFTLSSENETMFCDTF